MDRLVLDMDSKQAFDIDWKKYRVEFLSLEKLRVNIYSMPFVHRENPNSNYDKSSNNI